MVKKMAALARVRPGSAYCSLNAGVFRLPGSVRGSALAAAAAITLLLVVVGSVVQSGTTRLSAGQALVSPAKAASSPALSDAEEAYIQALWPIHGDVERSAVRVSLGTILYKTGDLERAKLKNRLETALVAYQRAEARISELKPPPSFARAHEDYVAAVRLYEQAAVEALKMFGDGDDAHLVLAHPLSHEGSNKIREIGGRFWRDEFPPN
jgi:hypothetical protein